VKISKLVLTTNLNSRKLTKNPLTSGQWNWKLKNADSFPDFRTFMHHAINMVGKSVVLNE